MQVHSPNASGRSYEEHTFLIAVTVKGDRERALRETVQRMNGWYLDPATIDKAGRYTDGTLLLWNLVNKDRLG
jgi:hypothetical protein